MLYYVFLFIKLICALFQENPAFLTILDIVVNESLLMRSSGNFSINFYLIRFNVILIPYLFVIRDFI